MQPTKTEAIKRFLEANTHPDLAALYNLSMEVQVNVGSDGGERVDKTFKGRTIMSWTNGVQTWKPFRIPRNAATKPEYEDHEMTYDLSEHAEGIGLTGWDWFNKVSRWLAYDFDAITGHANTHHKVCTPQELENIQELVKNVPWVTLRYSTSGKGIHLYIFLGEGVKTNNHTEHAALARSVLSQLSAIVGFDFNSKVDTCGSNMWIWHRKMRKTRGLELIKEGTTFTDIPNNWRDHIPVIKGDRKKIVPKQVQEDDEEKLFEDMSSKETKIEFDKGHLALIDYLSSSGCTWWYDTDKNIVVTHTHALEKAHLALNLKGVFRTISEGTDLATPNCFLHAMRNGAWSVKRFSRGCAEDASWFQDGSGWTKCFFNREPDLATIARFHGGKEKATGGYAFQNAETAQKAVIDLGGDIKLPARLMYHKAVVRQHKDGRRTVMTIERSEDDSNDGMEDWIAEKKKWEKVFNAKFSTPQEVEVGDFDETLRHLVTQEHIDAGWVINNGVWTEEPLTHIRLALSSMGHKNADVGQILGSAILRNWRIVNVPFGEEYPGGRTWNKNSVRLLFKPNFDGFDSDTLEYGTWSKIFNHLGKGLDSDVAKHPWCINNGVKNGADYLKCWVASIFQKPLEQLPYLFFYSEKQNTGKSTLYESLSLLVSDKAVYNAGTALESDRGFNGELLYAIVCYIEELDLSKKKGKADTYNRIKEWTTAKKFLIHPKGVDPYQIPNTTHWVHSANNPKAVPVFPGDDRIVSIEVEPLTPLELIPKTAFQEMLIKEAPDFLATILRLEIPPTNDRLNIPVVSTSLKQQIQESNMNLVEQFIAAEWIEVPGAMVMHQDFCEAFKKWVLVYSDEKFSSHSIRDMLPRFCAYGTSNKNNQRHIGNLGRAPLPVPLPRITIRDNKMYRGEEQV